MTLDDFIRTTRPEMLEGLTSICAELKGWLRTHPEDHTERGCDTPSINVRLCVDVDYRTGEFSWAFRTGDASFDQRHSRWCGASNVEHDTVITKLLTTLTDQIGDDA